MEEVAASNSALRPSGQRSPAVSGRGADPQVILRGTGRKQASAGLHLDPKARDPAPPGPQILHSLPLHVVIPSYPLLKPATKICSFSSPGREDPSAYLISQVLATQKETPKPYRLGRARL